jgi:hypothetical protein
MRDILWINLWNKLQLYYSNQNNILDIYNINQELDLLLTKSNINEQTFGLNMLINMLNHDYHDNDIPIYNDKETIRRIILKFDVDINKLHIENLFIRNESNKETYRIKALILDVLSEKYDCLNKCRDYQYKNNDLGLFSNVIMFCVNTSKENYIDKENAFLAFIDIIDKKNSYAPNSIFNYIKAYYNNIIFFKRIRLIITNDIFYRILKLKNPIECALIIDLISSHFILDISIDNFKNIRAFKNSANKIQQIKYYSKYLTTNYHNIDDDINENLRIEENLNIYQNLNRDIEFINFFNVNNIENKLSYINFDNIDEINNFKYNFVEYMLSPIKNLDDILFDDWNKMTDTLKYFYFDIYNNNNMLSKKYYYAMNDIEKCKLLTSNNHINEKFLVFENFFIEMLERKLNHQKLNIQEGLDVFISNCIKYDDSKFYVNIETNNNSFLCNIINIFIYYGAQPNIDIIYDKIFEDNYDINFNIIRISFENLMKKYSSISKLIDIILPYYNEVFKLQKTNIIIYNITNIFGINKSNEIVDLIVKYNDWSNINWSDIPLLTKDDLEIQFNNLYTNNNDDEFLLLKFKIIKFQSSYIQSL